MVKADVRSQAAEIAGKVRRLREWEIEQGRSPKWNVEMGNGRQDFLYRITCADGSRVQLHSTPSDRNWKATVLRDLKAGGFDDALDEFKAWDEQERQRRIAEDRRRNDAKTKALAAKAKKQQTALAAAAGPYAPQPFTLDWLLGDHTFPQQVLGIMTPEVAAVLMDPATGINKKNRPLRQWKVDEFKKLIVEGDFSSTHQGGAIDWNKVLQDGQKRLKAIIETGIAVEMWWAVGMDPANFTKIDSGQLRSGRDATFIEGIPDPSTVSAAAKILLQIETFGGEAHFRHRGHPISNPRLTAFYHRPYGEDGRMVRDRLEDCVRLARDVRKELNRVNKSGLAAAIYLIGDRLPEGDPRVRQFFHDVRYGDARRPDPTWHLRQKIINQGKGKLALTSWDTLAYTLQAWNRRCTDSTKNLRWAPGEQMLPTPFLPPPIETTETTETTIEAQAA